MIRTASMNSPVALLAEGVDRNAFHGVLFMVEDMSPSSRRAWIEIIFCAIQNHCGNVALLAEGVDRNIFPRTCNKLKTVALLAEGVDRNSDTAYSVMTSCCRPPRGGRG